MKSLPQNCRACVRCQPCGGLDIADEIAEKPASVKLGAVRQRSGAPLPLGDDQARGPHIPKKRLGDDTADHSERGQDKPDTSTERNTILAGHSKPSECHRWKITSAAVTGCLLGRGKSGPCRACVRGNAALLRS
jgi:hypothetical protein